jgi:hypothetical protein
MQRVDARLGLRKREPGEGIEPVVQVVRTRGDAAGFGDLNLIGALVCDWADELDRLTALRADTPLCGGAVEFVQRAQAEPRPQRLVDRVP